MAEFLDSQALVFFHSEGLFARGVEGFELFAQVSYAVLRKPIQSSPAYSGSVKTEFRASWI